MKILVLVLMCSVQYLCAASFPPAVAELKQRETMLLEKWHQQQFQVGQVLRRLRKMQPCPYRLTTSLSQNLKDLVHQNLAIRSLDILFKKQHDQIVKLCNDIAQVRQHLKMLNDVPR